MNSFTGWFLKKHKSLPEQSWRKVQILFFSTLISVVFTVAYAAIAAAIGFVTALYSMVVISILFTFLLIGLHIGLNHRTLARLFIVTSWFTLDFLILYSGGALSYVLPWLALLPVFGLLFLDIRDSFQWTIIGIITILIFWFGESYLPIETFPAPKAQIISLSLGLLLLLFIITRIFERQQSLLIFKVEEQNEELRATEEELRQNLEELRSTQEFLAQREAESSSIIEALRKHFYVSEYDVRGKTLRTNDKLFALTGLHSSREIGLATKNLLEVTDWEKLNENWPRMLQGEALIQEFKIHSKGNDFWINTTFAPIVDQNGKVNRVLAVGHEITLQKKQSIEIKLINAKLKESLGELEEKNEALQHQRNEIEESKLRLSKYAVKLMKLTRMPELQAGEFDIMLAKILLKGTITLDTSRVSLWRYDALNKTLICESIYLRNKEKFEAGLVLSQHDLPEYFKTILLEDIIVADNAREFKGTSEFTDAYLVPNDIYSMLDVPLVFDGKLYGVICCEQEGAARTWTAEDIIFAKSLADILVMGLSAVKRKENELKILDQSKLIQVQNESLMKFSEEIKSINQTLEARVFERTEALEKQNVKLSEYAFINAHLLRGPLCRILGLVSLLEYNRTGEDNKMIFEFLNNSTKELDSVIKRITSLLDEALYFDRKEFLNE